MRTPWSIQFLRKYRQLLPLGSAIKLRSALIAERRHSLSFTDRTTLRLKRPFNTTVTLRPASNDIYTLDEIFFAEVYRPVIDRRPTIRTVIDLGANIGLASIYFLAQSPECRVFSIEPDARNYALLEMNLASHRQSTRAATVHAAFWEPEGPVSFVAPVEPGHVNQGAVGQERAGVQEMVPGLSMNTILQRSGFSSVDLLKVDIEGGERLLFQGDTGWLAKVKCMALEFHEDSRTTSRFDETMKANDFRIVSDEEHTVVAARD